MNAVNVNVDVGTTAPKPSAGPARQRLFDMMDHDDVFSKTDAELLPLQLAAAQENFAERRDQVKILALRAEGSKISRIRSFADIVPLLFSHTTYKSYPMSFVTKGQWDRMTQWLQTLSAVPLENLDLRGIEDIDDWLQRLEGAGYEAITTSGTTGKVSIMNRVAADSAIHERLIAKFSGWPNRIAPLRNRHYFSLAPRYGASMLVRSAHLFAKVFGRPDSIRFLTDERLKVGAVLRAAQMRLRIASGEASPEEVAEFQRSSQEQAAHSEAQIDAMVNEILAVRHELCFITGLWGMYWRLMERARAKGIPDGDFNPETLAGAGGGLKGLNLPPDYAEQVFKFLGVRRMGAYGMSEMMFSQPRCEAGRFHREPWIIQLLLNNDGTELLDMNRRDGVVQGRFAFLDLTQHARWGGIITGDKVEMNFGPCPCGRKGPTVLPTITRFANLGEEDKIGCAGTIESYIRGELQ
jgi:hypothetical protein